MKMSPLSKVEMSPLGLKLGRLSNLFKIGDKKYVRRVVDYECTGIERITIIKRVIDIMALKHLKMPL